MSDLFPVPIEVVGHPIVREADGLALSSRNAYLSAEERVRALAISRGLAAAAKSFVAGERRRAELERIARTLIEPAATSVDYVEIRGADSLAPLGKLLGEGERAVALVACRVGATRLIDNLVLGEDPSPLP